MHAIFYASKLSVSLTKPDLFQKAILRIWTCSGRRWSGPSTVRSAGRRPGGHPHPRPYLVVDQQETSWTRCCITTSDKIPPYLCHQPRTFGLLWSTATSVVMADEVNLRQFTLVGSHVRLDLSVLHNNFLNILQNSGLKSSTIVEMIYLCSCPCMRGQWFGEDLRSWATSRRQGSGDCNVHDRE